MKYSHLILVCITTLVSCSAPRNENLSEKWKEEIRQAEKDFSNLSVKEGMTKAFLSFAADDAVLKRGSILVTGIKAIEERFESGPSGGVLEWQPDFVDVSSSGDLGYTYGHYTFTSIDSLGNQQESTGIFHTVWKRQVDGKWKFVWD